MEMTEIMRKNILFVLLIFLTSCLVEEVPRNMRKSKLSTKKTPAKNPTFGSAGELYWYTSQNNGKLVSISRENTSIVYLRGRLIHDFLKYKTNAAKKQWRQGRAGGRLGTTAVLAISLIGIGT